VVDVGVADMVLLDVGDLVGAIDPVMEGLDVGDREEVGVAVGVAVIMADGENAGVVVGTMQMASPLE